MCLAIPALVTEILHEQRARISLDGVMMTISVMLVEDLVPGDYLIVHVGHALARSDPKEAAITLALLPRLLQRRSGTIVNVSSLGGRLGIATEAAYSASKFALSGWSEALAADLVGTGVSVRLVLPGAIDTEIWDQPGNDAPVYSGPLVPAEEMAAGLVDCIDSDRFEHYIPDMKAIVELKTKDFEGFVAGMRAMGQSGEGS